MKQVKNNPKPPTPFERYGRIALYATLNLAVLTLMVKAAKMLLEDMNEMGL